MMSALPVPTSLDALQGLPAPSGEPAAKAAYAREARRKLAAVRQRMNSVEAKLSNLESTGLIAKTGQLDKARRGVKRHLARTAQRLDAFRKAGPCNWHRERDSVEHAFEDLSRSVRSLVAHLSRESEPRE